MTGCQWSISILSANWLTGGELKEKLFLLCDDDPLLQTDVSPSNKLSDRWRTEGENVSTLRRWSVAATGAESLKEIDGQVANRRRNCFYFAMMICSRWWISVLQGHLGTCREQKEKLLLLCNDDLLLLVDLRPSRAFRDRSRTEGVTDSTSGSSSVSVIRCKSFK